MAGLGISSEIGRLKKVIVHSPGPEVEAMTPREAEADLYNDIIPLGAMAREFSVLKGALASVAEVYELRDLLAQCLEAGDNRAEFLAELSRFCPLRTRMDELGSMPSAELARVVIEGLPASKGSLSSLVSGRAFSLRPLPNTYFMRDSAAVVGDWVVSSATAFDVRLVESLITRFLFLRHPLLKAQGLLIDGPSERNRFITIEGGDIIVLSRGVLAVGVSERSTADAVERLAVNAAKAFGEKVTVFAVALPKERACIHLDMVFTAIDRDAALVYSPLITGRERARVLRIDADPQGRLDFSEEDSLLKGLKKVGIDLEAIPCGGEESLFQDREQWWSGANSFAFAPGKILMYTCNALTLEQLSQRGFAVVDAEDVISGRVSADSYARLALRFEGIELARGGGGARCMTMPVLREAVS